MNRPKECTAVGPYTLNLSTISAVEDFPSPDSTRQISPETANLLFK